MMKTYFRALFTLVLASAGIAQASVVYNNTGFSAGFSGRGRDDHR